MPSVPPPQAPYKPPTRERPVDRLERIYADAAELQRRLYAGVPATRRAMQTQGMGQRRYAQACAFLLHAGTIDLGRDLVYADPTLALRNLSAAREHYLLKLSDPHYVLPF